MVWDLILIVLIVFIIVLAIHTSIRVVRRFYKFPMPSFLANIIDNPLRRRIQPVEEMPLRLGIEPGMTVLEIGPGHGRYTVAAAKGVGRTGRICAIDIERAMLERARARAMTAQIINLQLRVASIFHLPFEDASFDLAYMIAVIGEIPTPERAMHEVFRVLRPSGVLAISELLFDPDFSSPQTLESLASSAGFEKRGSAVGLLSYTIHMAKPVGSVPSQVGRAGGGTTAQPLPHAIALAPEISPGRRSSRLGPPGRWSLSSNPVNLAADTWHDPWEISR